MTTHLITFSDESMSRAAQLCVESAKRYGVDRAGRFVAHEDSPESKQRGFGFWKWKPQIIYNRMADGLASERDINDGDILIYSDAGVEFTGDVHHIIDRMDQDIFLFGNHWQHAHWCKRDIIEAIWPVRPARFHGNNGADGWENFGKQAQASVIFFRVSDYSKQFVKEWLDWCLFEGGRLIDDSPSEFRNHPEFQENRHDQAILTTMAYREGIKLHYWPAMYEGGYVYDKHAEYASDDYPTPLFFHHRKRNNEWEQAA